MKIRDRWKYGMRNDHEGNVNEVITSERMGREEVRGECERKISERLSEARLTDGDGTVVNDMFRVCKEVVITVPAAMIRCIVQSI